MHSTTRLAIAAIAAMTATGMSAQDINITTVAQTEAISSAIPAETSEGGISEAIETVIDSIVEAAVPAVVYESLADSLLQNVRAQGTVVSQKELPRTFFLPAVYNTYIFNAGEDLFAPDYSGDAALQWLEDLNAVSNRTESLWQRIAIANPSAIPYNIGMLPEAPKKYDVVINPDDYTVNITEKLTDVNIKQNIEADAIDKKHWIKAFTGNLQFSQAYVSPNWYQGGNNNLNMLLDVSYNVKLNQKFHPNYLFESNFQYRLGTYSTPEDSLRNYNISQDLLQINSTLGIKAIKKWYYTLTAQFKTQIFDSYTINTRNLRSSFMSPGELNVGIGMTYNTTNKKKTFTLDASISPLSYNLMICRNDRMNKGAYGIDADKTTSSKYGSSLESKVKYQMTSNISLASRLFAFTDYDRAYADLENTIVFEINKYLTTQVFVHLRYDTNTPFIEEGWHKLQVKEILSLGFTYKFSTL